MTGTPPVLVALPDEVLKRVAVHCHSKTAQDLVITCNVLQSPAESRIYGALKIQLSGDYDNVGVREYNAERMAALLAWLAEHPLPDGFSIGQILVLPIDTEALSGECARNRAMDTLLTKVLGAFHCNRDRNVHVLEIDITLYSGSTQSAAGLLKLYHPSLRSVVIRVDSGLKDDIVHHMEDFFGRFEHYPGCFRILTNLKMAITPSCFTPTSSVC